MKKSLIALAVLASTGAAMAQSSVTLYGIIDVNLQSTKGTDGVRQNLLQSGGINGSRFGLKGSEDLGGGLKAVFVLENGFNVDNGTSGKAGSIFNRQSYVGLAGSFGEFDLGNTGTAYDDTAINSNPLWDGLLAPSYSVWQNGGAYSNKPGNMIKYSSPSFGGVTVAASYALGENKTATSSAEGVSAVNVQYTGGPLYLSLAYQVDDKAHTAAARTGAASYKDVLLNASYDLGVVKLEGSYNQNTTDLDLKSNQFQFGVDVPVGPALVLSTGYAYSKDKDTNGVSGTKRDGLGLGAKYSLSKRTFVYTGALWAQSKPAVGDKVKTDVYTIGLNHSF
jgi:predicted porin